VEFLNFCRQQGIFAKDICVECLRKEFGEDWALRYLNEFKGTEIEWDHCYLLVREKDIERLEKELRKLCETRWGRLRKETLNGESVILLELSSYDERVDKIIKVGGRRLCDDKLTTGFLVEEIGV